MLLTWDSVEFILFSFFFRYWVSITRWWKDTRLISDKTRINYWSFPRGQVFSLGIRLTRLTIPRSAEFIQVTSFFFSLRSLHGIILEFGFLSYPKVCSWFFNEQRQLLMRLHPLTTTWQHLCVFTLWWMNGNWLISVVWKFTTCWFFWRALSRHQIWSRVCFSADTYMANREWGPPMPISACNNRDEVKERWSLPLPRFYNSCLLPSSADSQMY